jgi:mannose-1-phosphate guanylyltransferase
MQTNNYLDHTFVVILCGGSGTRVWPLSINKKPKQFLNFYSNKSLYQEALDRSRKIVPNERIIVITNKEYLEEIKKQSPEIPAENIIGEPQKKNTAMAMGVAAALAKKRDSQAILVNLPSDHVVPDYDAFAKTLKAAAQVAYNQEKIVAVGIKPTYPHPGFGYIKVGNQTDTSDSVPVNEVLGFKEKPSVDIAKKYLEEGNYLWNAGFYIWRCDIVMSAFDRLSPQIASHIHEVANALGSPNQEEVLEKEYSLVPEEPIDTAISEKADNLVVLPGNFTWNDIGSWEVVYELGNKDEKGNVLVKSNETTTNAPVLTHDARNCLVYSNDLPVAIVGLSDIVVVDTGKGILICARNKSNDVKKIVEQLTEKKLDKYL